MCLCEIDAADVVLLNEISFLRTILRVLVGAQSDASINVDDPISDEFFFVAWNEASKQNATIYDKVKNRN